MAATKVGNIMGPTGPAGSTGGTGPQGPAGGTGPTGPAGTPGMIWSGAWNSSTAYVVNDVVSSGGSSYICIVANTNQPPTNAAYWSIVAQTGATGPTGPTGGVGPAGTPGTKWFNGTTDPGTVSGSSPGDYYLNTTNGDVWTL